MALRENLIQTLFEIDKEKLSINDEFVDNFLKENSSLNILNDSWGRISNFFISFKEQGWTKTGIELVNDFLRENQDIKEIVEQEEALKITIQTTLEQ